MYLPCDTQSPQAFDNYRSSLAQLNVIIREQNFNNLVLVGDFNADPFKGRFWRELLKFTQSLSLIFVDEQLPQDTFSYLSPAKDSTSWLDHIFASKPAVQHLTNIIVDYESSIFDHFPICFHYAFHVEQTCIKKIGIQVEKIIIWNRVTKEDKILISHKIDEMIKHSNRIEEELFYCSSVNCKDQKHLEYIDKVFDFLKLVLFNSTDEYCFGNMNVFKIIPG